ncbi:iron reductase [Mycena rebaudengoi]|nr:iron reductase [Mycena rebaudengoi]
MMSAPFSPIPGDLSLSTGLEDKTLAQSVDPNRVIRIRLANLYPKQIWYFLAVFIALVSSWHIISVLLLHRRRNAAPAVEDNQRGSISWRRLPLAMLNFSRAVTFRWTIIIARTYSLNLADVLLTGMYITILFTWNFHNSKNVQGLRYDPKYWANRASHIAATQLPLMTAFGMRNNFISLIAGISFDKLNYLHRVTARVICVLFWVHAIGRSQLIFHDIDQAWFGWGVAGGSALLLLCLLSLRPLRSRSYEWFLIMHLALGLITLVGAYLHSQHLGYGVYVWPSMFLWGLDRFLRLTRIVLVNSRLISAYNGSRRITSEANVQILSPHFLRISIPCPPYFSWKTGQSSYLTLCGVSAASVSEAHPFTISNSPREKGSSSSEPSSRSSITEEKQSPAISANEVKNLRSPEDEEDLIFILRARTGFTKRLMDSVTASPTATEKTFKAFVDGPYGSPPAVRGFDTVVFVCGGSGVSFTLPLFLDLIQAATVNTNRVCRRVVFIWAVGDIAHIKWISDAVSQALAKLSTENLLQVDIRLHVTASTEDTQFLDGDSIATSDPELGTVESDPSTGLKERLLEFPVVKLSQGRPDIPGILNTEIVGARGSLSVNVCGTMELAQSARTALRGLDRFLDVLRGGPNISLHVEGFGSS